MGFLKDSEVIDRINKGELILKGASKSALTPNGYDLSIDKASIDLYEPIILGNMEGRIVFTKEYLKLNTKQTAMLFLRSSYSRLGGWGSFGFVDAGFEGILQFVVYLPSAVWKVLREKEDTRMVQIVFYEYDSNVAQGYAQRSGNYQGLTIDKLKKEVGNTSFSVLDLGDFK